MATQLATVDDARQAVAALNNQLATRADQFKMVLPAHIKPEQFQRTILTAAQSDPDLLKADRQSLLLACMKAAQDGLLPDKREAALVIFSTRTKQGNDWVSVKNVQYMPMVYGLRKKILQSGEISSIETSVVYRREFEEGYFVYEAGTEAQLRHKPMLDLSDEDLADDNIIAAYSVAVMKDGTKSFEVMRRADINKVRQASQTGALGKTKYKSTDAIPPKGPWVDWFAEMARKTVMRRHSKTLPMSGDLIDVEARDEEIAARSTAAVLSSQTEDAPRALPPSREDLAIVEGADPATGEIARDEEDEETARALDRQSEAAMERRDDGEGPSDEQRGETNNDSPANDIIARVEAAAIIGDVIGIEQSYQSGGRDMFETEDQDRIEQAFADAKARLKGGAK